MPILISLDPGKSSGSAVLGYDESAVWLIDAFQVAAGVDAFRGMVTTLQDRWGDNDPVWISEKFSPRPGQGFTHGLDSTIPLVCEGVLIDRGLLPEYTPKEKRWRAPVLHYVVGGESKAQKKARLHRFLKDSGFYRTGKDLGAPDADDFRSAAGHGLAYLAREVGNKPAYDLISTWVERNPID